MKELQEELGLEAKQMEGIWAHCNGKHRPKFVARRFRTTPKDQRVTLCDEFAHLYHATPQDVIEWALAGGFGNGNHPTDNPA